jgi:hypothetical protein
MRGNYKSERRQHDGNRYIEMRYENINGDSKGSIYSREQIGDEVCEQQRKMTRDELKKQREFFKKEFDFALALQMD